MSKSKQSVGLVEQGLGLYGRGQEAEAVACWQKALQLDPEDVRARDYLEAAGALSGERPLPRDTVRFPALRDAPRSDVTLPEDPWERRHTVLEAVRQRRYTEALELLRAWHRQAPEDPSVHRSLQYVEDKLVGRLVARFGGYDARLAPRDFDRSAARDGLDEFLLDIVEKGSSLAGLLRRCGLPEVDALRRLERLRLGDRPEAVAEPPSRRVAQPDSDDFDATFREALEAYLKGDVDRAVTLFEVCERLRPGDRRVAFNLARLRARRGG